MLKRLAAVLALLTISALMVSTAQAACVKKQVYCKKITFKPSGTQIYLALSKKSLDRKSNGRFALMATSLQTVDGGLDQGGLINVIGRVRVATGFKLSSKIKRVKIITPGDDDASVVVRFLVTPSVGTIVRSLSLTPSSISLAG